MSSLVMGLGRALGLGGLYPCLGDLTGSEYARSGLTLPVTPLHALRQEKQQFASHRNLPLLVPSRCCEVTLRPVASQGLVLIVEGVDQVYQA